MEKITKDHPAAQSADIVGENIQRLKELFPDAVTEGRIDFEVLRQLLGDEVDDRDEKYGLNWNGKRRARQLALTPSLGTLRPCPEESVDWDTTKNIFIEGDNLEVLKLLQKSYAGKVKLIYIDPPYNTGNDFVYKDDFQDNIKNYQMLIGARDSDGRAVEANAESSGRFHTEWLNMIYPRLRIARNMLSDSGVLLISIDDGELDNARKACAEIFGGENFLVQIVWRKRSTPPNDKIIGANHDYILAYAKNIEYVVLNLRERSKEQTERYRNPDAHTKGPWVPGDLMGNVKGGRYVASLHFAIKNPNTGEDHYPGTNGNWRFSKEKIAKLLASDEIYFGEDGRGKPKLKRFLSEVKDGVTYPSIWDFVPLNTNGSAEMNELFGNARIFENPKPIGLLQELIKLGTEEDSIVMDFFAGSGTLGDACMRQNLQDGGMRSFILIQLPEVTGSDSEPGKMGYGNLAALTRERLRRAGTKLREENPMFSGDLGFRAFKLDSSNIRAWNGESDDVEGQLDLHINHLVDGRTEQDVLYELLLKLGLDLCVPIETKRITTDKTDRTEGVKKGSSSVPSVPSVVPNPVVPAFEVHSVGGGVLMVCLATSIPTAQVEALGLGIVAWHAEQAPTGETQVVFRDSAFADDVAKTNMTAILEQNGIKTVRSL